MTQPIDGGEDLVAKKVATIIAAAVNGALQGAMGQSFAPRVDDDAAPILDVSAAIYALYATALSEAAQHIERVTGERDRLLMDARGYTGPVIQERIRNALLTDAWLAEVANAYDIGARCQLDAARAITPDTWDRRQRIKRHQGQAHYEALHAAAFRELLRGRQLAAALKTEVASPLSRKTTGGGEVTE